MYAVHDETDLDAVFSALANPTRRAILARLVQGEASITELQEPFGMSQPAISQHVKVLESAGLVLRRAQGTRRPCRLAPDGVAKVDAWLELLRTAFEANYARLDRLLAEEQAHPPEET